MTAKETKKFDFARSYNELQDLVGWFEKGEVDLEEGIKKFEDGLKLVGDLKKYLNTVENKVKQIKAKFDQADNAAEASEEKEALF